MVALTFDDLKAKIADGSIFAITVDSSIIGRYQWDLDSPVLRKLNQFNGSDIRVFMSDIVMGEVRAHIAQLAAETQRDIKVGLRKHNKRWKLFDADAPAPRSLSLQANPTQAAESQVEEFVKAISAEIVISSQTENVSSEVLRRYFAGEPPFRAKDKKKNEFPDAFALLSLEFIAERERKILLCISNDDDWREFITPSNYLVLVDDLDAALSLFNATGRPTAERAMAFLRAGTSADVTKEIESAFEFRLSDADFVADGWSSVGFDTEPKNAVLKFIDWDSASSPTVIAVTDSDVTFTTRVEALVKFSATFSFGVRDSIDRDYVSLGSQDVDTEDTVEFELALTVSREFKLVPEVYEAEVAMGRIVVDFGTVEPFQDEDPYNGRY